MVKLVSVNAELSPNRYWLRFQGVWEREFYTYKHNALTVTTRIDSCIEMGSDETEPF